MDAISNNAILYVVEFLKLFLTCVFLIGIRIKSFRAILVVTPLSVAAIAAMSYFFDMSQYAIVFGLVSAAVIFFLMEEKKKIPYVIFAYICICLLDMLFSVVVMYVADISSASVSESFPQKLSINCISLVIIIVLSAFFGRHIINRNAYSASGKELLIFIVGGVSLSLYIASIQFFEFTDGEKTYRNLAAIGLSGSSVFFIIICAWLVSERNKNRHLKSESEINAKLLEAQEKYYTMLLQKETETRAFRHDIQNHLYCMHTLLENREYKELDEYLTKINGSLRELKPKIYSGNILVDAMADDISGRHSGVRLEWTGKLIDGINISSMDICVVFSNLLNNAFEAAERSPKKTVRVSVKMLGTNLLVSVSNYAKSAPERQGGKYVSTKSDGNHGFGIRNVENCLKKNNGFFEITFEEGVFTAEVIFMNAVEASAV